MTLLRVAGIVSASWAVLAALGGFAWAFAVTRLKRRDRVQDIRGHWMYPPPVPSPIVPADWFYDIPADCLSDDAIRPLFDDITKNFRVVGGEFA